MPWGCVGLEGFVVGFHLEVQHHKPGPDHEDGAKAQVLSPACKSYWSPGAPIPTPLLPTPLAPDPPGPTQKPVMMPTTQATLT